jgi:hypothetical protein
MKGAYERREMYTVALPGKTKDRQLEVIHLDVNIILKWIINIL